MTLKKITNDIHVLMKGTLGASPSDLRKQAEGYEYSGPEGAREVAECLAFDLASGSVDRRLVYELLRGFGEDFSKNRELFFVFANALERRLSASGFTFFNKYAHEAIDEVEADEAMAKSQMKSGSTP